MAGFIERLFPGKKKKAPFCSAVLVAAGSATRMEGIDKIMTPLGGEPLLLHSIRALENCDLIGEIVVVTRGDLIVDIGTLCKDFSITKVSKVIIGGETRTKSVFAGVGEVSPRAQLVAVHDGARPFPDDELLEKVILRAAECGAAAPAVPVKETVKRAQNGLVLETLNRSELFLIQTPQVFERSILLAALSKSIQDKIILTDDCAAVEHLGMTVALTRGSEENIKITTPFDLMLAQAILEERDST